jgi:hypothetical protein
MRFPDFMREQGNESGSSVNAASVDILKTRLESAVVPSIPS